jgi:putative SOS response-associated peptidase YedK
MCGRYELNATPAELLDHFGNLLPPDAWQKVAEFRSYNVAPSLRPTVIRYGKRCGHNVIENLVWGYRPHWAKRSWINARDDTLFETAAFRESAARRRCLVVATGWYEWQQISEKRRQPYYLHFGHAFAFAGVWTARKITDDEWEASFAIVTTAADGLAAKIHDRMPLVLDSRNYAAWLDPKTEDPRALLVSFEHGLSAYPVSTLVNDPKNDDPKCIEPADVDKTTGEVLDASVRS